LDVADMVRSQGGYRQRDSVRRGTVGSDLQTRDNALSGKTSFAERRLFYRMKRSLFEVRTSLETRMNSGARSRDRTGTPLLARDFKSRVSTSFTIRAAREILAQPGRDGQQDLLWMNPGMV
jgi:hypothetical protein